MEELQEVQYEDNKSFSEKSRKRTVKSRMQIEGLEKLYNEHKYPTELMKSQLAESLGLTEKQVSGWFCHRRLKDKRVGEACASGRQDRSSGVIQDRGSGLMQDSCGSTKQGDYAHFDPREVESRRLAAPDFVATNPHYELGCYNENDSGMDDTSSGSISPVRDRYLCQNKVSFHPESPRYLTQNGNIAPVTTEAIKVRNGPSGYLKVKCQVENAAITAVKRQLGRHYKEHGPLLGVEFDPLPPGAFESSVRDPVNKPYFVEDIITRKSPGVPKVHKPATCGTRYELQNPEMNSHKLRLQEFECQENYSTHQIKKSILPSHGNFFPCQKLSTEVNDDSDGEGSARCGNENYYKIRTNNSVDRTGIDSASSNLHPSNSKVRGEYDQLWLNNYVVDPNVSQGKYFEMNRSQSIFRRAETLETENRGQYRVATKDDVKRVKYFGERRAVNEHRNQSKANICPTKENVVGKGVRVEFLSEQHLKRASMAEMPSLMNRSKRSMVEMPSSFSEDETAETDCSV